MSHTATLETAIEGAPTSAKVTLLTLFLINFLNFFDRAIPAVVLEPIRHEFQLNDTLLGLIGTAFTLVYALAGLPLGRLADRMRRTHLLAAGVFVWSLFTAASSMAWNFTSFLFIRMGVGIGEASCAPAANSMIGDMYPSEKRARATGVFMLGLPLGTVCCFALVGYLAQRYGWRATFLLAAVPGILVAMGVFILREPVRGAKETYAINSIAPIAKPFQRLMRIPTLWWIVLSGATINFAAYSLATFLPAFLVRYHHASVAQAGFMSAVVLGVMGLIGLTCGGLISDFAHARFAGGRLKLGAACLLVAAPLLRFGFQSPAGDVWGAVTLLAIAWLLYFMYFVTVYPAIQDVVPPQLRGTAMAVYFFFQYVLGGGFGTVVTGALSDMLAKSAMRSAGSSEMTDVFRAVGLQLSLGSILPLMVLVTGVALAFAARRFTHDRIGAVPASAR